MSWLYREPMAMSGTRRQAGFTLLEVLAAIAIFALMYVLAQQFFGRLIDARDRLDEKAAALEQQQRALLFMMQDFEQLIVRPVRDRLGDVEPALMGGEDVIEFTRLGWANPFSLQHRSNMQRVRYVLHEHHLVRRHWPVLDVNVATRPVDTLLLDKVQQIRFRYLVRDEATQNWLWLVRWPDAKTGELPPLLQPLPASVEITIDMENGTQLHRFFRLITNPWTENSG